MANQYHHRLSLEGVEYVIHHLFLPAKLPQKDDFLPEHETLLISLTCRALSTFEEKVEDKYRQTVQEVHKSLKELSRVLDNDMCINEYLLVDSLNDIALKGKSAPPQINHTKC